MVGAIVKPSLALLNEYKLNMQPKNDYRQRFTEKNDSIDIQLFSEIQKQLQSLANLKNIQDPIVLKINLKEYRNKLRFRIDSSAFGYDAYFTEEPIPDFCITCLDLNTWKEI